MGINVEVQAAEHTTQAEVEVEVGSEELAEELAQELAEELAQEPPHMLFAPVPFEDADGNPIPSWQVSLDGYLTAHEGIPGDWRSTHLLVVARAIAFGQPVPPQAREGHDPAELHLLVLRERCVCERDPIACEELRNLRKARAQGLR